MAELYERLEEYRDSDYYPFHMPGHKRNKESAAGVLADVYGLDITEIDGFDNLHCAAEILKKEQERAARIYGSEASYFLVNGSTSGILSAIAAVLKRGSRLLMARNCHKSVYHGVYLRELEISYLYPDIWKECGAAGEMLPESVEKELRECSDIGAVLVTSPTYEGVVSDIKEIALIAHKYRKPLIVDEAHGAHFGLHEEYPESSVKLGADIVIHSLHKTLPSMTQTALIHVNGNLVDRGRLERYLRIFQTSSPSYVLMASISSCLDIIEKEGKERLGRLKEARDYLEKELSICNYIKIGKKAPQIDGPKAALDPCKLVMYAEKGRISGQQLYHILRNKYHLQMEMAAGTYVLAILSPMDTRSGIDRLCRALLEIDKSIKKGDKGIGLGGKMMPAAADKADTVLPLTQAYDMEQESIELEKACGRIAAEFINLYPPGIPIAVPGERINENIIRIILAYRNADFHVQGAEKGKIRVIKECCCSV